MTTPSEDHPRDAVGRRRSPATFSTFRQGQSPRNKGDQTGGVVYDTGEVLKLLDTIPTRAPVHVRERAVFVFLWRTGIGVSELPRVRYADLNLESGKVHVRRTKERRERDVLILGSAEDPGWGLQQLQPWLDLRAKRGYTSNAPLFCIVEGKSRGGPVAAAYHRQSLKRYAEQAKLLGRFNLAGFRNTLAVEMYKAGTPVPVIQHQLGHGSLATTQTMLERLGVVERVESLDDYNPAGAGRAPRAHADMPDDVRAVYEEARLIVNLSPRGSAALLRLALQLLLAHLGETSKDLNTAIGALVARGLPVWIQQSLDTIRVVGNEAVHPGTLDLRDDRDTALKLFSLMNLIIEHQISQPRELAAIYAQLPEAKRDGIAVRDRRAL